MSTKHTEYYILNDGKEICCPESRVDKNAIITWFQNNKKKLESEYGDLSKARLIGEVTEVHNELDMELNNVKFILKYIPPKSINDVVYYVTRSNSPDGSRFPFISPYYDDLIRGNLIFDSVFLAKRWLEKNDYFIRTLYKEDIVNNITIEAISELDIISYKIDNGMIK